MRDAHLIEATFAVSGGAAGFFTAIYEANLVLGFISAVIGTIVGGHALYKIIKSYRQRP